MSLKTIIEYALAIGVIISSIGVIISLFTLAYQSHLARFKTSIELVLRLEDRFNNQTFEDKRIEAASALLSNNHVVAEGIYDFFETIGFLVRKNAIPDICRVHSLKTPDRYSKAIELPALLFQFHPHR